MHLKRRLWKRCDFIEYLKIDAIFNYLKTENKIGCHTAEFRRRYAGRLKSHLRGEL